MFWTGELIARSAPVRRRLAGASLLSPLLERATAAYLGLAIGDALGATVEFMTPSEIRQQYGVHRDIIGGGWLRLKAGQVTDDTTMSLALGDAILAHGRIDAKAAADAFDAWMRAKPVDIGNTIRRNLITYRKTGNPEAPLSEHDAGNGAAMRVLPVALATYSQPADGIRIANAAQAHTTHHNALSDAACEVLILMVQDFLACKDTTTVEHERLIPFIDRYPVFSYNRKRRDNPSGYVVETLQAVLQAFFTTNNFEDCLVDVINRGGDADTTGAITGMLAGARYGLAAIPRRWCNDLESDTYRRCRDQAQALIGVSKSSA
ncbi:MAG: ADP-ribosyl-[dinitrogen reductase] hydrolase [Betaproteobacteria bacterium]|nr:ADP-ribosyl-[dinitrogen reductase] hydrolase [Betaproteobacteria bacterium]